jgi:hypothetical protein
MSISVINGGGIVQKSGALFRVLIVLAILLQGSLFVHNAHDSVPHHSAITQQQ